MTTMRQEQSPPPPPRKSLSTPSLSKKKKLLQFILSNPSPASPSNPNPNSPPFPDPNPNSNPSSPLHSTHHPHPHLLLQQKQKLPQQQTHHLASELQPELQHQRLLRHHLPRQLEQFKQQIIVPQQTTHSSPTDPRGSQDQGGGSSLDTDIREENGSKPPGESEKGHSWNLRRRGRSTTQGISTSSEESRNPKRPRRSHGDGDGEGEPLRGKSQSSAKTCKPSDSSTGPQILPNSKIDSLPTAQCSVSQPPSSNSAPSGQATEYRTDPILAEGVAIGVGTPVNAAALTPTKLLVASEDDTLVPSKEVLREVLDELQKKDKLGVFSEPVDTEEVPEYYDIIKEPMDFGTMRKRIAADYYVNLELFEKDVFKICNNAMTFNAVGTVYYRHGRTVKIAAERCFQDLKANLSMSYSGCGTVMRQKTSFKKSHKKKVAVKTWMANSNSGYASETIPSMGDCDMGSQAENMTDQTIRTGEDSPGYFTKSVEVRRSLSIEENRRNTYRPVTKWCDAEIMTPSLQFVPAACQFQFCYAKSLSRFVADLGPSVWRTAANKIRRALPADVPFGPGWIAERGLQGRLLTSFNNKTRS